MDEHTVLHVSENGWTDSLIALDWLEHFNTYTKAQTRGKYRLLILDGHASHVSFPFIQYCEDNNIIPLCLPPHYSSLSATSFNPYSAASGCLSLLSTC